jgi:hypothetical protein
LLRIVSQNSNRKLIDVAEDVLTTGALELPTPRNSTTPRPGGQRRPRPARLAVPPDPPGPGLAEPATAGGSML